MSHGGTPPPSTATRALYGPACAKAGQPQAQRDTAHLIATRPHPYFSILVRRALSLIAAALLFAGGIAAGLYATTAWPGPSGWFGPEDAVDGMVLKKLTAQLDLTPKQTAKVAPIVASACTDLRIIGEERRAESLEVMDELSTSIAPELTADQQQRLEGLQSEWQNRPTVKRDMRIVALY